jgi:hypothetical protein
MRDVLVHYLLRLFSFDMIAKSAKAFQRRASDREQLRKVHATATTVFTGKTVVEGPFRGLQYADWRGHGSAVFAKLLGAYEAELHPFIETVLASGPETVIDIGCAEGFYVVGCAWRLPTSRQIAADLSPSARELCVRMAQLNGVNERVDVIGRVTREDLLGLWSESPGWLISDCEGGEAELFDPEVFSRFAGWFILIELHEFLVPGIEERLIGEASRTHAVEVVDSIDDYRRERLWPRPCLEGVPSEIRHEFYREGRPGLMRWICASPLALSNR